jgi:hypothetical protein
MRRCMRNLEGNGGDKSWCIGQVWCIGRLRDEIIGQKMEGGLNQCNHMHEPSKELEHWRWFNLIKSWYTYRYSNLYIFLE